MSNKLQPPFRPLLTQQSTLSRALEDRKDLSKSWISSRVLVAPRTTLVNKRYISLKNEVRRLTHENKCTYSIGAKGEKSFLPPEILVKADEKSTYVSRLTSHVFFRRRYPILDGIVPDDFVSFYIRKYPNLSEDSLSRRPKFKKFRNRVLQLLFLFKETVLSNKLRRDVHRFLSLAYRRPEKQVHTWYHFLCKKLWRVYCNSPSQARGRNPLAVCLPAKHWCRKFLPRSLAGSTTEVGKSVRNADCISLLILEPKILVRCWDNPTVYRFDQKPNPENRVPNAVIKSWRV